MSRKRQSRKNAINNASDYKKFYGQIVEVN